MERHRRLNGILVTLVLLTAVAGVATCCALAMQSPGPVTREMIGYTSCEDGKKGEAVPKSWVDIELLGTYEGEAVAAHERFHWFVVKQFKTCAEYRAWLHSGVNALINEAAAFCVQSQVRAALEQQPLKPWVEYHAHWLAQSYPEFGITYPEALELVSGYCRNMLAADSLASLMQQ